MQFLENLAIAFFDGLTNTFDNLHTKVLARRTKKRARDKGGQLPPGMNQILNTTGKNEPVLSKEQWQAIADHTTQKTDQLRKELEDLQNSMQPKTIHYHADMSQTDPTDFMKELDHASRRLSAWPSAEQPQPADHLPNPLTAATIEALKLFESLGIKDPAPWIKHAARFAACNAQDALLKRFAVIATSGHMGLGDINALAEMGIKVHLL